MPIPTAPTAPPLPPLPPRQDESRPAAAQPVRPPEAPQPPAAPQAPAARSRPPLPAAGCPAAARGPAAAIDGRPVMSALPEVLPGPYATRPSPDGVAVSPAVLNLARSQVQALLESAPAFRQVSPDQRRKFAYNLVKVAAYTAALLQGGVRRSPSASGSGPSCSSAPDVLAPFARAAAEEEPPPPPPPQAEEFEPARRRPRSRGVTKDTLNAIAFPTFVADLIRGTFNAIVNASIQQMEAYGELLANVAKTVDQFMADNITDNQARDCLASQLPGPRRRRHVGRAPRALRDARRSRRPARGRTSAPTWAWTPRAISTTTSSRRCWCPPRAASSPRTATSCSRRWC